ncbi:FAD:protein FMN transferase [Marilutibacter alkalisoli]|uniref:FAD:protein FMN transferase n=1 Tax=Marilutibacter alkalisoli TaxID=2591633 RepID=A0A514BPQ3_9GAMM|nr:FAD:protein FMN transferase [Lysobacter alkalisoli]QDH69367.1 FAD:protein FMN transferase [Lysobacter alkalisoli]
MNAITAQSPAPATLGGESMGTTWSVKLAAPPGANLHALHHGIQSVLDDVVAQMSNWEPDSDLARYNAARAGSWHALTDGFWRVLQAALEIAAASDGAFDPTVGALADTWGFGPSRRIDTSATALEAARSHMGWRRIELDAANHRALQPGGVRLDLCAIAKGHAVDAVAEHLRARGIANALVEVGGELSGYGRRPDGTPWRVLVEAWTGDEDGSAEPRVLALDGLAVATSGERWHHHQHDGIRASHTLDPRSGKPARDAPVAVTVVASDAMHADGWATALTVLGIHTGYELACARGLAARFIAPATDGHAERMTPAFNALLDG